MNMTPLAEPGICRTIDGAMTRKKFLAYVEQCLALTLKRKDIVMIDNLPAHKAVGVREAIKARDATLYYLPKYSSDLNPIEMSLSKLKAYLQQGCGTKQFRACAAGSADSRASSLPAKLPIISSISPSVAALTLLQRRVECAAVGEW